jgi:hypothetical protein
MCNNVSEALNRASVDEWLDQQAVSRSGPLFAGYESSGYWITSSAVIHQAQPPGEVTVFRERIASSVFASQFVASM